MSATDALLLFIDAAHEFEGWLQLRDGAVVARGVALEGLPALVDAADGAALRQIAVVPGEQVSLHWLEVPAGLAPAQAVAAARMAAAEVSAQPLADMHVAVGREDDEAALRTVALAPALAMAGWIGKCQANGLDPDLILPEPLLLRAPATGFVRYDRGDRPLYRGAADAFMIEPELAEIVLGGAVVTTLDHDAFEAGLGAAVAAPPVNLRQGVFAKRRRWKIDWPTVRRLLALGLAILAVTLAIHVVLILRYTFAADELEREANQIAATALPGSARLTDGPAALARRLTELRGGGAGYGAVTSALFGAVRATANAELTGIVYERDGSLRATVQGDTPATLAALQRQIEASGFAVAAGPMRMGGGRQLVELTVRAR